MHTKRTHIILCVIFGMICLTGLSQESNDSIQRLLRIENSDDNTIEFKITSEHISTTSGIHHIYYHQEFDGIPIRGTESSAHFSSEGNLITESRSIIWDVSEIKNMTTVPKLTATDVVKAVAKSKNYVFLSAVEVKAELSTSERELVLSSGGISDRDIPTRLVYAMDNRGIYQLTWEISILELDFEHWWSLQVNATTGEIIKEQNRIVSCSFGENNIDEETDFNKNLVDRPRYKEETSKESSICENCYEVFALPLQSPYYGERSIVENPAHPVASPFGWHDTDGQPGPETRFTEGNNVVAIEGNDNFGFQPYGGERLDFTDFPFNQYFSLNSQYESAAITNLFYWSNMFHDVFYVYGFTEEAGNFQENSYDRGGQPGDSMRTHGQRNPSGGCAAFFGFTPDGESPLMVLGTCGSKDGSYDSVVTAHEYGHGITSRLIGGPNNIECLENDEQMSEGWCDWFGTILTIKPGDMGLDKRQIGNYYFNKLPTRNGVRRFPYTTDMTINPQTYRSIGTSRVPHGVGAVWANMLWEMTWSLIDEHGYDTDVFNFTGDARKDGGNVIALAIVTEALKLTPCKPGFVNARDAILQADRAIYGGYNQCFIWNAFAKRGLGINAAQGRSDSKLDGLEDFEGFIDAALLDLEEDKFCFGETFLSGISGGLPQGGVYSGPGVIDDGNGVTFSLDVVEAGLGSHQLTYDIEDSQCADASSDRISFQVILDETPPEIGCPGNDLEVTIPEGAKYALPDYSTTLLVTDFCSDELIIVQEPEAYSRLDVGLHDIVLTALDASGNESTCEFSILVLLAIDDDNTQNVALNALEYIGLFPNPSSGLITLINPLEINILSIEIRDILGRNVEVIEIDNSEKENKINLETLASGSYFLTVNVRSGQKVIRLVKK